MGTWSTTAPTNLATSWTDMGKTEEVHSGFYKGDSTTQISYYFWSHIYIARNKRDELVVCIELYSRYGKAFVTVPGEGGHQSNSSPENQVNTFFTCTDTSTPTEPSIYHKFGEGAQAGIYYYTLSNKTPTSITCGVYTSVLDQPRSTMTITNIPKHIGALLWVNVNNEWKEAQIFSSTGTSWKEGVIFDTTHLPS